MSPQITFWSQLAADARTDLLARPTIKTDENTRQIVKDVIDQVRDRGDAAVREMTRRFDRLELGETRVSDAEVSAARASLPNKAIAAIDLAISNVQRFHERQVPQPITVETMPGVVCERLPRPIDAVGLYVPAGTAPLPSAAIMLAVPASIAGCPTRILCTPPRADGCADPAVVVAANRAGVNDIYKVGGAQAIAAMAYGTESIPRVGKIFGPGNQWVTCAKSLVSADPAGAAIDLPAGPSEVLIIADSAASPEFVAADLLSQAEHGVDSQVVLITSCGDFAQRVRDQLENQLTTLSRANIAKQALQNSRLIVVDSVETAISISNVYAPEHLILQCHDARRLVDTIRNAGSVFVGPWTPESVGDYCSGTNHVLPTCGHARTYSGLGVDQFLRQMTVQEVSREGLENLGDAVVTLAKLEGLDAHAASVKRRLVSA